MAAQDLVEVECPVCKTKQYFFLRNVINMTEHPEEKEDIITGSVNQFRCRFYAFDGHLATSLFYHDMAKKLCICYIPPENLDDADYVRHIFTRNVKISLMLPEGEGPPEEAAHVADAHIVFSMPELSRYVLFRDRLDDIFPTRSTGTDQLRRNPQGSQRPKVPGGAKTMPDVNGCRFCTPYGDDIVVKNSLCYARWDRFPVSKGHLLIIPFRHIKDYFSLTKEEKQAITDLIEECRTIIEENFRPDGYNIGFNIGEAAGQSVMHCHCHFIPRYRGDTDNPKGGVRRVVAGKYYTDPMRKAADGSFRKKSG